MGKEYRILRYGYFVLFIYFLTYVQMRANMLRGGMERGKGEYGKE